MESGAVELSSLSQLFSVRKVNRSVFPAHGAQEDFEDSTTHNDYGS